MNALRRALSLAVWAALPPLAACGGGHGEPDASVDVGVDAPGDAAGDADTDANTAPCADGATPRTLYIDGDGDGFGWTPRLVCPETAPGDLVSEGGDCDDADPARFPREGLEADHGECGDHLDNDCDGAANDGCGPGTGEEVLVPPGPFTMGCSFPTKVACRRQELPAHRVEMTAYAIDKYEVTVAEFVAWLNSHDFALVQGRAMAEQRIMAVWALPDGEETTYWRYDLSLPRPEGTLLEGIDPTLPMATAGFYGARAFCRARGSDLPTEAMWEKAARGGLERPDMGQRVYPWGDDPDTPAAVGHYERDGPVPVGSYPTDVSPYGLLDMGGNVTEWVSDWADWDEYLFSHGTIMDPTGPAAPSGGVYSLWTHVTRGGDSGAPPEEFSYVARRHAAFLTDVQRFLEASVPSYPGRWGLRCGHYIPQPPPPAPLSCPGGVAPAPLYTDADGDGFGAGEPRVACPAPGLVARGGDCDDAHPTAFPRAVAELDRPGACDNDLDDNCDGLRNEGCGPGSGEELLIPAGPVRLGCISADPDCDPDESPTRLVDLPAFVIDKYEVTLGQWLDFLNTFQAAYDKGALSVDSQVIGVFATEDNVVGWVPGTPVARWDFLPNPGVGGFHALLRDGVDPMLPVGSATEYGAAMYCRAHGGELPTEAQWEKAARGGIEFASMGARLYPTGLDVPAAALDHPDAPRPVGTTAGDFSPYGVADMVGNVREWTRDFYWPDPSALPEEATWARTPYEMRYWGPTRVTRGGDYRGDLAPMRTSARNPLEDDESERLMRETQEPVFGFRCVRDYTGP